MGSTIETIVDYSSPLPSGSLAFVPGESGHERNGREQIDLDEHVGQKPLHPILVVILGCCGHGQGHKSDTQHEPVGYVQELHDFEGNGFSSLRAKPHTHGGEHRHKEQGNQQRIGHASW